MIAPLLGVSASLCTVVRDFTVNHAVLVPVKDTVTKVFVPLKALVSVSHAFASISSLSFFQFR
jgi:hypothetical protein